MAESSARPGWIKRLTEYFSVVTAASFAVSILANQLVFDRWGLNFLQLATIADVVMSGLSLLMYTLPLALMLLLAWWAGGARGAARWLLVLPYLAGLFLLLTGVWALTARQQVMGGTAALALGAVIPGGLLIKPALRLGARHRRAGWVMLVLAAGLLLLSLTQFVGYTVMKYASAGYAPTAPLHLVGTASSDCNGHVLWTGERALVLDCEPQAGRQDIRVALNPENWVFKAEAGTPAHSPSELTS